MESYIYYVPRRKICLRRKAQADYRGQEYSQKEKFSFHDRIRKGPPSSENILLRYKVSFHVYCYSCNHFGHKAVNCRDDQVRARNGYMDLYNVQHYKCHNYGHIARNCGSIMDDNDECLKCHNYGHIAQNWGMPKSPRPILTKVW